MVMSFDTGNIPFLYVTAAATLIILWAIVIYVIERRRVGSTSWSEWYNDRVVLTYRRRRPSRANGRGDTPTSVAASTPSLATTTPVRDQDGTQAERPVRAA
jgi:hypothetical protein